MVFSLLNYKDDARSHKHKIQLLMVHVRPHSAPPLYVFSRSSVFWAIFRKSDEKKIHSPPNLTRITSTLHEDVRIEFFLGGSQIFCVSLILTDLKSSARTQVSWARIQHVFVLSTAPRETLGDTQPTSGARTALIGCLHAVCIDFHTSSSVRPSAPLAPSPPPTTLKIPCFQ